MKTKNRFSITKTAALLLALAIYTQKAYAAQLPTDIPANISTEPEDSTPVSPTSPLPAIQEPDPVYQVTISFHKNGGKGSMDKLSVSSDTETSLKKNTFKRTGFQFTGWSTQADGSGEQYADGQIVTNLATEDNNSKTITLYAQWKLIKPAIQSAKSSSPENINVTYKKNSGAAGYEFQYAVNKSFKNALTAEAGKKAASITLENVTPGKKYYIRMRSYYKSGSARKYSNWSKTASASVQNGCTIVNTKSYMAIEADVKLSGTGTGYHAKLVMATPHSAVSYGIQFDHYAQAPYTGKAMAMIENVSTNNAGGQRYTRPGEKSLALNKTYHLMMAIDQNGNGDVYLDYEKIGSFSQPNLAKEACYLRIEASARKNGDSVDATFSNIKCKWNSTFDPNKILGKELGWTEFKQNPGLQYSMQKKKHIRIHGTIQGISGDWDSDFNRVSEILQFN